jgi:hypothetical protein
MKYTPYQRVLLVVYALTAVAALLDLFLWRP